MDVGDVIAIFVAVIATGFSYAALVVARQQASASSLFETLVARYVDPTIATQGWDASGRSFRELKWWAKSVDADTWSKQSAFTPNDWTLENRIAYHTAFGLQNLGFAVFSGAIPLAMTLETVAVVIVDDWIICQSWVRSYQKSQNIWNRSDHRISYQRRRAELLVLLAASYLEKNWSQDLTSKFREIYEFTDQVHRIESLLAVDIIPLNVMMEVRRITNAPGFNI